VPRKSKPASETKQKSPPEKPAEDRERGGLLPSLWPLTMDEAVKAALDAPPMPKREKKR
jgi:hypothetical protein